MVRLTGNAKALAILLIVFVFCDFLLSPLGFETRGSAILGIQRPFLGSGLWSLGPQTPDLLLMALGGLLGGGLGRMVAEALVARRVDAPSLLVRAEDRRSTSS